MSRLKEFWKKLNYPMTILDDLLQEPEEGKGDEDDLTDPVELATEFGETQRKLIVEKSGLFTKEHMDNQFNIHRKKLASDINKSIGLGLSRSELDELEWNDFTKKAGDFVATSITEANKHTDDKLKNLVHQLKSEKAALLEQVEGIESTVESKVAEATEAIERERDIEAKENLFNKVFNQEKFDWNDTRKKIDQSYVRNVVENNYEIHRDGTVTQNGGKEAVNLSGNGFFKNLDEVVTYLFETENLSAKHKGGTGGSGGAGGEGPVVVVGKTRVAGKVSDNALAMQERALKQRTEVGLES